MSDDKNEMLDYEQMFKLTECTYLFDGTETDHLESIIIIITIVESLMGRYPCSQNLMFSTLSPTSTKRSSNTFILYFNVCKRLWTLNKCVKKECVLVGLQYTNSTENIIVGQQSSHNYLLHWFPLENEHFWTILVNFCIKILEI